MNMTKDYAMAYIVGLLIIDVIFPFWPVGATILFVCLFHKGLREWIKNLLSALN